MDKRISAEKQRKLLDDAHCFEYLGLWKMIIFLFWAIFQEYKASKFLESLDRGMHAFAAWNTAKNFNNPQK